MAHIKNWATIVLAIVTALVLTANSRAAPKDEILFIFNHGSSSHFGLDCYRPIINPRPQWLDEIDGKTINGKTIRVTTPCTGYERGKLPDKNGCGQSWVCNRAIKIAQVIKDALDDGYEPQDIFVGGHSAGGWSSLLIKRWRPQWFNSAIVTAPAFNGTRRNRLSKGNGDYNILGCREAKDKVSCWNGDYRKQHNKQLGGNRNQPPNLRALAITFPCDSYARPEELPFPEEIIAGSFRSIVYPPMHKDQDVVGCAKPHKEPHLLFTNGEPDQERCDEPASGKYFKQKYLEDPPAEARFYCGSSKRFATTRNMILNCDPKDWARCRRDQHTRTHRSDDFAQYISSYGVVIAYMKQQLENWRQPTPKFEGGTPCYFLDIPEQCKGHQHYK